MAVDYRMMHETCRGNKTPGREGGPVFSPEDVLRFFADDDSAEAQAYVESFYKKGQQR